jgi:chromosomal replication initiation ATPase DnaA
VIRVNVVRFERFIMDNDAKRQRALKKERDEITERLKLQQEVEALELSERRTHMSLRELMDTLRRLAKYEEFLEGVVDESEFAEITEVLFKVGRYKLNPVDP